jgi:hypothetical protein
VSEIEDIIKELLRPLDEKYLGPHKFIYCYLPAEGGCPALEFLNSLSTEAKASYAKQFEYHCQGHTIRGEKWRTWGHGLYEYKDIPSKSRLMHITEKGNLHILLFGFTGKNENKVDTVHVLRAQRMQREYQTRADAIRKRGKKK